MNIGTSSILLQLALDYNQLISSAESGQVQQQITDALVDDDIFDYESDSDDELDVELERLEDEMIIQMVITNDKHQISFPNPTCNNKKRRKDRYDTSKSYFTNPATMQREPYTYEYSSWYINYICNPLPERTKWAKTFRSRFRMPYSSFLDLAAQCNAHDLFATWSSQTGPHPYNKRKPVPMKLLVLSALRYLGRGWTTDDIEEATAISKETIRIFLHKFMEFGASTLYNKYVLNPTSSADFEDCENEFKMAGFPGCIGSADASHIVMEVCPYCLRQLHLGYKLCHTTRKYNITVNHRRRILSSTSGHPARFNNKTLVLYDDFINALHFGKYDNTHRFTLLSYDNDGNIIHVKYRGCYVIVDNGYLSWSVMVLPIRDTNKRSEIHFSEWLESLRKDVECTFGILKG